MSEINVGTKQIRAKTKPAMPFAVFPMPLQEPIAKSRNLLRESLHSVFPSEKACRLLEIINKKRHSHDTVLKRMGELREIMGQAAFIAVMRRSPSMLYCGQSEFTAFKERQTRDSQARHAVFRAFHDAGLHFIGDKVVQRVILHPSDALETVSLFRESFGDEWKSHFLQKASPDGSFFLKPPHVRKKHIASMKQAKGHKSESESKRNELISLIGRFHENPEYLVSLYIDKIKACSLERAIENAKSSEFAIDPEEIKKLRLPWSSFFSDFNAFVSCLEKRMSCPADLKNTEARLALLIGTRLAEKIISRCGSPGDAMRALERLEAIAKEHGKKEMLKAARKSQYIFSDTPFHYCAWQEGFRIRMAEKKEAGDMKKRIFCLMDRILGKEKAEACLMKKTLSDHRVLRRVSLLKAQYPDDWESIIRTRPSCVLSVSGKKFQMQAKSYFREIGHGIAEAELASALGRMFGHSAAQALLSIKKKKRMSARTMLSRLSEIESFPAEMYQHAIMNCAWVLTAGNVQWEKWARMRRMEAKIILMVSNCPLDKTGKSRRICSVMGGMRSAKLKQVLSRLEPLHEKYGEAAVNDAIMFNWHALLKDRACAWGKRTKGEFGLLVPIKKSLVRLSAKFALSEKNGLFIRGSGHLVIHPESGLRIRIFWNGQGEAMVRNHDLPILNLYLRLKLLKDRGKSLEVARKEIELLKKRKSWNLQERVRLWILRFFAIENTNKKMIYELSSKRFDSAFSQGLPYHPAYMDSMAGQEEIRSTVSHRRPVDIL